MAAGRIELTTDWQELSAGNGVVLTGKAYEGVIQVCNAASAPTGDVDGAMTLATHVSIEMLPAPLDDNLYVRVNYGTGVVDFYEV